MDFVREAMRTWFAVEPEGTVQRLNPAALAKSKSVLGATTAWARVAKAAWR